MRYLSTINEILLDLIRPFVKPIVRKFIPSKYQNEVIIRMDGGICSQIHFYLIGCCFAEKGNKVLYDLKWYKKAGVDTMGIHVRNFDLLKLNPFLNFEVVDNSFGHFLFTNFLKSNYKYSKVKDGDCSWLNEKSPVYMGNYYHDFPVMFTKILPQYFKIEQLKQCLDSTNVSILSDIEGCDSVAIHVRRGDLVGYNSAYGAPCSIQYFINAVKLFNKGNYKFLIFSDDPEWCNNELIKQLPQNNNYQVLSINGSDKGYMDLVLMASCKHTITSKGSLGKYSAMLNNSVERVVVLNDDKTEYIWKSIFKNHCLI